MALIIGLKWGRHIFIVFGIESDGHGKEGLMAGFVVSNMIMWIYLGAVYLFQQLL